MDDLEDSHILPFPKIVLRDSLGYLAVQVLTARNDLTKMSNLEMILELHQIISDLHDTYDSIHNNIPEP